MMKTSDVAPYVRDHAPWLAELATEYVESLQDASAYPFFGHVIGELLEKSSKPTEQDRADIEAFFRCVEVILVEGDTNVQDLVYIEIAQGLRETSLRDFFGPHLCEVVRSIESIP